MKAISTPTAPAALGPYSQAIDAGAFVFVSGQVPVNPATGQIPLGILVVYSFAKKTQTTPKTVIDLCRKRLALYDSMK